MVHLHGASGWSLEEEQNSRWWNYETQVFFEVLPSQDILGLKELGGYFLRAGWTYHILPQHKAWDPEEVLRWQGLWFYYTWWVRDRLEMNTAGVEIRKRDSSSDMLIFVDYRSVFE